MANESRFSATGRRKEASARVWLTTGTGAVTVNSRPFEVYFKREVLRMILAQPFEATEKQGQYDIHASVKGGGLAGQAGAIRHGLARALIIADPSLRPILKKAGLLTRDSRAVERKKYGRPGARKRFQFSKR